MSIRNSYLSLTLVFAGMIGITNANATETPVKLLQAKIDQSCSSCGSLNGTIQLNNLAYEKHVEVLYQVGNQPWTGLSARFQNMIEGTNEEVWSFATGSLSSVLIEPVRFAIRYEVAGKVFWDNNCGEDYQLNKRATDGGLVDGHRCP